MRLLILVLMMICFFQTARGETAILAVDIAENIIVGQFFNENLDKGHGYIKVLSTLVGDIKINSTLPVQFSEKGKNPRLGKAPALPSFHYVDKKIGIWLLGKAIAKSRHDIRRSDVFFEMERSDWLIGLRQKVKSRTWTKPVNGLSGSIIVDESGSYRFFYLSLRNDSMKPFYVNRHYRIKEHGQQRFLANVQSPDGMLLNTLNGSDNGCILRGAPGWPKPEPPDFVKLVPGQTMYQFSDGILRCFFKNPPKGIFTFSASYLNEDELASADAPTWKGKLQFPATEFN